MAPCRSPSSAPCGSDKSRRATRVNGVALHVASLLDLAGTKAAVVQRRAETRDYVDMDALIRSGIDLPTALAAGQIVYGDDFNYFFDVTSQLYYQRKTPADYRSAINGFFGAGATTDRSIECIIANLPADRPAAGPPLGGAIKVN